jgi:hypothetical protein
MMTETNTAGGITFRVADVPRAKSALPQIPYKAAVEGLLEAERLTKGRDYRPIEAWTRPTGRLVADIDYHPVAAALCRAYAEHRPVCLSPDMIWLLICQGIAHHINANAEELRRHFVRHDGKLALKIRRDDFDKGSPDNPWSGVFGEFSAQIEEHIGPRHALFVASFSTTGAAEKAVSEIVLLEAMQRYFHYSLDQFICGIPAITLEGTPADWRSIEDRVEAFAPLGMEWWLSRLRPILRQFCAAVRGDIDRAFWRSIYRIYDPGASCGDAPSATGWINLFFPYFVDEDGLPTQRNPWLIGERDLDELLKPPERPRTKRWPSLRGATWSYRGYVYDAQYPSGLAKAPFTWAVRDEFGNLRNRWDMEFLGGFVGIAQDPESFCLRPEIGWAVREAG